MKTVGIIAEFNPFHNGHKLLIDTARRNGADNIIIVMSGEFVQSGEPAFASKELRCRLALECGCDAVFLLPAYFATSSAEGFAYGGISLLNSLGIVDEVIFGSETDDINLLKKAAKILVEEPAKYSELLRSELKTGVSFPKARANALVKYTNDSSLERLLSSPNSILGIEYCKALYRLSSKIRPVAVLRRGDGYHASIGSNAISSATGIRELFIQGRPDARKIALGYIPKEIQTIFASECTESFPILRDELMDYLLPALLNSNLSELTASDLNGDLKNRLLKLLSSDYPTDYEGFIHALKTKNETFGHIGRVLIHILLGISSRKLMKCPYGRILGFRNESSAIFSEIKEKASIPLISRLADAEKILSDFYYNNDSAMQLLSYDKQAYRIYQYLIKKKYDIPYIPEERIRLSIL